MVRDGQTIVFLLETAVEQFVLVLLPLGGSRVAEENPAAEGADGMDGAKFALLKGTASAVPRICRGGVSLPSFPSERGQLHRRDEQAVAKLFEAATATRKRANGLSRFNTTGQVGVEVGDGP